MRGVVVALVLSASAHAASAQETEGKSAGPGMTPHYETTVSGDSPAFTQDRTFPGTRFWKLDQGHYEIEQWWRLRAPRGADAFQIWQTEIEMGLTRRVQLDLYENLSTEGGDLHHEGNQIEARIALDPVYGRTPMNPVLYLEWHPMHLAADRAEVRLLGGGQLLGPKLVGAVNLFFEQNVTNGPDASAPSGSSFAANPELGATGAISYAVRDRICASARRPSSRSRSRRTGTPARGRSSCWSGRTCRCGSSVST